MKQLKKVLPPNIFDVRDFDERGVPDGGGPEWHNIETQHWLSVAAQNALNGKNTIVSGFINPEEFEKIHNPDKDIPAQVILLDVSADVLRKRLYGRHATSESRREIERAAGVSIDEFVEQCAGFLPKLRLVFERNNFPIIDTDNKASESVAQEVMKIILSGTKKPKFFTSLCL